ncbi:DegV family protein [Proteinivorax hydrogeniformans]|uniref:DegV family protein n=1 Tax=Proteinivorax hydrogeniformans TaxID=1826727 RepID=A0AAU8HV72_9FIRM
MKIKFVVDSTCDIPEELVKKHDISVIPLEINWENETYKDGVDLSKEQFMRKLEESDTIPKTSQPSVGQFAKVYEEAFADGYDKIISIHITAGFSGTFQGAEAAAEMVNSKNIAVIDSYTTTMGAGWLVLEAIKLVENGASFEEVVEKIKVKRENSKVIIYLDTLEYAIKGGRISKLKGIVGSFFNIKPIIYFENKMVKEYSKSRGKNKALQSMVNCMSDLFSIDENKEVKVAMAYGADRIDAEKIMEQIKEKYNVTESMIYQMGSAVAVHGGPGLLAMSVSW